MSCDNEVSEYNFEYTFEYNLEVVPLVNFDLVGHLNKMALERWELVSCSQVVVTVSRLAAQPEPGYHLVYKRLCFKKACVQEPKFSMELQE